MRSHGWAGNTPSSDEEAINRILDAADDLVERKGPALKIADVARELGVSRPTVYRYFPSSQALLLGSAARSADGLLDRLIADLKGESDPVRAVTEGMMMALTIMTKESDFGRAYLTPQTGAVSPSILNQTATALGRSMLHRLEVDWQSYGYDEPALQELAEFLLRTLHSLLTDPGDPPRTGDDLRNYLIRWLGPVIEHPRLVKAMEILHGLDASRSLRDQS